MTKIILNQDILLWSISDYWRAILLIIHINQLEDLVRA